MVIKKKKNFAEIENSIGFLMYSTVRTDATLMQRKHGGEKVSKKKNLLLPDVA